MGNANLHFHALAGALRSWSILMMLDRQLRLNYRYTVQKKFLVQISIAVGIYTIFISSLVHVFNFQWFSSNGCFFVVPLWTSVPLVIAIVSVRLFAIVRIKDGKIFDILFLKLEDRFGIAFEVKCDMVLKLPLLVAYLSLARSSHWQALAVFFAAICLDGFFTVILPIIKLLFCKNKISPQVKYGSSAALVDRILEDKEQCKQFRIHACKSLCSEGVDFCINVRKYRKEAENALQGSSFQTLHELALQLAREFVFTNSPSEVNIPSKMRDDITQSLQEKNFFALEPRSMCSLFDRADAEVLNILALNLFDSFIG